MCELDGLNFDRCRLLSKRTTGKGRGEASCSWCSRELKGLSSVSFFGVNDGNTFSERLCLMCLQIHDEFCYEHDLLFCMEIQVIADCYLDHKDKRWRRYLTLIDWQRRQQYRKKRKSSV